MMQAVTLTCQTNDWRLMKIGLHCMLLDTPTLLPYTVNTCRTCIRAKLRFYGHYQDFRKAAANRVQGITISVLRSPTFFFLKVGVKEGGSGKQKAKQNGSVIVLLDKTSVQNRSFTVLLKKAAAKEEVAWQKSGRKTEGLLYLHQEAWDV